MTLNPAWLDDFLVLAESGNISRAADERHITQPAFSRRIRALEQWLGVDLFDRSGQPATLTEAGHWFRQTALDLQARVAKLPAEARAVAQASAASLSFAATHALSFSFVPRWLHRLEPLTAAGPIRLVSDVQQRCEALLLQDQVHFVVTHAHPAVPGPLDEAGCRSTVIGHDRLLPVSAPDRGGRALHRLDTATRAGGARVGAGMTMLGYSDESGLGRILAQLKGRAGGPAAQPPRMTAHLASVLRTMVLDGQGLAWLPGILVDEDVAAGRLVIAAGRDAGQDVADDARRDVGHDVDRDAGHDVGHHAGIDLQIRLYRAPGGLAAAAQAFWQAACRPGDC